MYIGFNMWVKAVEKAGSFEPDKVIDAMIGVAEPNLTGGLSTMMPNHHITKPVYIGEIQADGQFEHGLADARHPGCAGMVALPRRVAGSDRRLAQAALLRQLQRQDRQVRRLRLAAAAPSLRVGEGADSA